MKIAIIGFGHVGKQFAHLFNKAGYEVMIGLRSTPDQQLPYSSATPKEAAAVADMVAIAIPFTACAEVLPDGNVLDVWFSNSDCSTKLESMNE